MSESDEQLTVDVEGGVLTVAGIREAARQLKKTNPPRVVKGDQMASAAAMLFLMGRLGVDVPRVIDEVAGKIPKAPRPRSMVGLVYERMKRPLFESPELSRETRQQKRARHRQERMVEVRLTHRGETRAARRARALA